MNNRNIFAAISYVTWVGFLIAAIAGDRSDRFMAHHLNQALVINLAAIVGGFLAVIPVLGSMLTGLVSMATLILGVMGVLSAYRGSMEPLPLIGDIHLIG